LKQFLLLVKISPYHFQGFPFITGLRLSACLKQSINYPFLKQNHFIIILYFSYIRAYLKTI